MSKLKIVDVHQKRLQNGEVVDTIITSDGFLNWKHHVETCITKRHHKYDDLLQTSCTRYFRFFHSSLHWNEYKYTYVSRIEKEIKTDN